MYDIVIKMRRKRDLKKICCNVSKEAYEMLEQLTEDGMLYMCQVLDKCIRGKYYSEFKSNKLLPRKKELTPEEKKQQELANYNWLEGDTE